MVIYAFSSKSKLFYNLQNMRQLITSYPEGHHGLNLVMAYRNGTQRVSHAVYHHDVSMNDEASGYSIDFPKAGVYGSTGDDNFLEDLILTDCLQLQIGAAFSTWDRDNDGAPQENCAMSSGAGWWYFRCDEACNPMLPAYQVL